MRPKFSDNKIVVVVDFAVTKDARVFIVLWILKLNPHEHILFHLNFKIIFTQQ